MATVGLCAAACSSAKNPDGGLPTGNCYDDQVVIAHELSDIYSGGANATPCARHSNCALLNIDIPCQSACPVGVLASKQTELRARIVEYGERACALSPNCGSSGNCIGWEMAICTDAGYCARGLLDGGVAQ